MKRFFTLSGLVALSSLFISSMYFSGGSPGAKTGSPLDGANCSACHSSSVTSQDWIETDIPITGYVPGEVYTITATGMHTGVAKFGFELTAEDASAKVGEFAITNATETKLINDDNAVTHSSGGTTPSGDSKSWSCQWTAPATGTGNVIFYAAFNAANNDGSTSGDVIYTSMLEVQENTATVNELQTVGLSIYPNPASENIKVTYTEIIQKIEVYDIAGKAIQVHENVNSRALDLNVHNLPAAVYFIKVYAGQEKVVQKVRID